MKLTSKTAYVSPETVEMALAAEQDVLVKVSGGDIENPGDGGEDWDW